MNFSALIIVDDDEGHSRLIERNIKKIGFTNDIIKLTNGLALIDLLDKLPLLSPDDSKAPCIILDINMPIKNGLETLEVIKNNVKTKHIPVIMVSTTANIDEINRCYKIGCNGFITKPAGHTEFKEKIHDLALFLSSVVAPSFKESL